MERNEREVLKKQAFWVPCRNEDALHKWIKLYLGVDLPKYRVDNTSNSTPMSAIWEVYRAALENDPKFKTILAYSARAAFKTLSASILEVLMLVHLNRNVCHLAAIEPQAKKAQNYVKGFLHRPYLREFIVVDNDRDVVYTRHRNLIDKSIISPAEFEQLSPVEKESYETITNYVHIVVCTLASVNHEHTTFMCVGGDTKIQTEYKRPNTSNRNRNRRYLTARSIFNQIAGLSSGGNPKLIETHNLDIAKPKKTINVLSLNIETGKFEFKPITRGHRQLRDSFKLKFEDGTQIICTDDHPLYIINKGFTEIKDISTGDYVLKLNRAKTYSNINYNNLNTFEVNYISNEEDTFEQVILGSLLGDGSIGKRANNNAYLHETHCLKQKDYLEWKYSYIRNKVRIRYNKATSGYTGDEEIQVSTGNSQLFNKYVDFKTDFNGIDRLGSLGLAIWYMDDGCSGNSLRISSESFTKEQNEFLKIFLKRKFGIEVKVKKELKGSKIYYYLRGNVEAKRLLANICKDYIYPSMAYKFDLSSNQRVCDQCGDIFWFYEEGNRSKTCGRWICKALYTEKRLKKAKVVSKEYIGAKWVYDFTVADNHNFFGNGLLNKNCVDECDLMEGRQRDAFEDGKFIPDTINGQHPITLYTSTRKYSYGVVQDEIDKASDSGLIVRHWNIIDVTERCPRERCQPQKDKVTIYYSQELLRSISEDDWLKLNSSEQAKYTKGEGYWGCLNNCSLFVGCRGRLFTEQKSKSSMLKSVEDVIGLFKKADPGKAKAQLLCLKPSEEGLIYPFFNQETHMLTVDDMFERITGERPKVEGLGKMDLIGLMRQKDLRIYTGIDHGYTHCFAMVTGAVMGHFLFVFDAVEIPELELSQKIELMERRIKYLEPIIYPDTAYPADNITMAKMGFHVITDWSKKKGSVVDGIDAVRMKLMDSNGKPSMFFLKGDLGCENLCLRLSRYHWTTDTAGQLTDIPDETEDDSADALRYLVMNVFGTKGHMLISQEPEATYQDKGTYTRENWNQKVIEELTGNVIPGSSTKRKGKIIVSI